MRQPIRTYGGSRVIPVYRNGKLRHWRWVNRRKVARLRKMHSSYQKKKRGW